MRDLAEPSRGSEKATASASPIAARARRLRRRADALLAGDPTANILDLDNLLTDACATVLDLRRRQRRLDRQVSALILEEEDAPPTAARAAALARESRDLRREIAKVQELIEQLTPYRRAWERAPER